MELRDILAEVLPLVRVDHVIPYNSEVLSSTLKRGLISTPPCHMISDESSGSCVSAWVRNKNTGIYQRPRLFTPYYEEAKVRKGICINHTVEPILSGHSKIDKTKILMTKGSLMKVKSIAECSPWSILQYF